LIPFIQLIADSREELINVSLGNKFIICYQAGSNELEDVNDDENDGNDKKGSGNGSWVFIEGSLLRLDWHFFR